MQELPLEVMWKLKVYPDNDIYLFWLLQRKIIYIYITVFYQPPVVFSWLNCTCTKGTSFEPSKKNVLMKLLRGTDDTFPTSIPVSFLLEKLLATEDCKSKSNADPRRYLFHLNSLMSILITVLGSISHFL